VLSKCLFNVVVILYNINRPTLCMEVKRYYKWGKDRIHGSIQYKTILSPN